MLLKLLGKLGGIALVPGLNEKARTQRRLLVYQGSLMAVGGLIWGGICLFFGLLLPALVPFGYTLLTILNFSLLAFARNFSGARFFQVFISLLLPILFQYILGGYAATGAVSLWALLSLVSSIAFSNIRTAILWAAFFIVGIVGLGIVDSGLTSPIPPNIAPLLFVVNIAVISAMVVALIIYFVTSRDLAQAEMQAARRETETILNEVREGLILIDSDLSVGGGHSDSALELLGRKELIGLDFPDLIADISATESTTVRDYLGLIFSRNLPARKIAFLNPLTRLSSPDPNGEERTLAFTFRPIAGADGRPARIFATIVDISEEVKLEREIKSEQRKSQKRIELISQILYSRPALIRTFLDETAAELEGVDDYLNANERNPDFPGVARTIFRAVHAIKGNAALIRLDYFVKICHEIEEGLERLLRRERISGLDLLEPVGALDNLKGSVRELSAQFEQLQNFGTLGEGGSELDLLKENLRELSREVAAGQGKSVDLKISGVFDPETISLKSVRTLLVQLLRNAISHGIEKTERRGELGKPPDGTISIEFNPRDDRLEIVFTDDGSGFDIEKIKEQARARGDRRPLETEADILQIIFEPGFSTRTTTDRDAGRGIGLDILKAEIKRAGGRLRLRNRRGAGAAFTIELPLAPKPVAKPA